MFIALHQARSSGQRVLKEAEFSDGFQQSIFKNKVREQGLGAPGAQFSDWLMVR